MKILKIRQNKDGSATMDYELNAKEKKMIKQIYGWKKLTPQRCNQAILEAIENYIKDDPER